jgi:hypothetical protein
MKIFAFAVLITIGFISCGENKETVSEDSVKKCAMPSSVNPNGDSELALLMREMANWTDSCKAAITSGRTVPSAPANLNTLHTAKRTDPNLDEKVFSSMASLYQSRVTEFQAATEENRTELFNAMVQGCVSCHENFCHGPLVRINKMLISADQK